MRSLSLLSASLLLLLSGCLVVPQQPVRSCVAPEFFCPAVTEFAPQSDRFPYLDRNERWRLMSEPEFRERFHIDNNRNEPR